MADKKDAKANAAAESSSEVAAPTATDAVELKPQLLAEQPLSDRWKSWWTRIGWSLVLVGSFCVIIALGHLYLALLVLFIEHLCFYEIMNIAFKINKAVEEQMKEDGSATSSIPLFRTISMWFLFAANYYFFARGFYMQAHEIVPSEHMKDVIDKALRHHQFISFCLYIAGIVAFVLTLRKGHYRRQFSNFGWTHVSCLIVVGGASFIIGNIYEGLIWFLLPVFIVICNDCTAYIFGFFFGHTPLIELSPKKTWEGFMGAFASTMAFAWIASYFFAQDDFFRCPVSHTYKHGQLPSFYPMYNSLHCEPEYVFTERVYEVPEELRFAAVEHITAYPCQLHALVLALFGSLIAPFGGFMASGFKRAFKVKDFSDLIPGHGGVMDRFDCQFLMGAFTYVYYQSFINPTLTMLPFERIGEMVSELSVERKIQLYNMLKESLIKEGGLK